jgi:hypothetical protein
MKKLVSHLVEGPIDLIGDVHGELDALISLIKYLGYDQNANHPDGRRLVFLGDLVDRGPKSISLLRVVKSWIDAGKAQCILGNHEFNILKSGLHTIEERHGNHWFIGKEEGMSPENPDFIHPQELATFEDRKWMIDFFDTLPIALENDSLGVVHACWHQPSIDELKYSEKIGHTDVTRLYKKYRNRIYQKIEEKNITDHTAQSMMKQNENPLKVLTSGFEELHHPPYYAGGKMRHSKRTRWWDHYQGKKIVIGHYWRKRKPINPQDLPADKVDVPDMFDHQYPFHWMGKGDVMCIDYSAGLTFLEREKNTLGQTGIGLCAMRWPEQQLYFDDGEICEILKA